MGITTTDDGNYWCNGAGVSSAESGQFVLSSCRSRLDDFYFSGTDTDASPACTDFCELENIEILADDHQRDPNPSPRPWLESIDGTTNLPAGVSATEALQCFTPQGINGCGFESHLESMWKALKLTQSADQDEFGFLRDQAALAIVFVERRGRLLVQPRPSEHRLWRGRRRQPGVLVAPRHPAVADLGGVLERGREL